MAVEAIKVPSVGESVTEGILARWLKSDGSAVKAGDSLYELETDKASTVVPATTSGVLKIQVPEGSTVKVGATLGTIDPAAKPAAPKGEAKASLAPADRPKAETPAAPSATASDAEPGDRESEDTVVLSPAVRRLADEQHVELSQITGTGRGGRITKGDVLTHLESTTATAEPAPIAEPEAPASAPANAETRAAPAPARPSPAAAPRETRQRMSGIRQRIAQRLVEAQQTAAILTTFNEADMSRILELRARYKEPFQKEHGVSLGFMSFFIKASIAALKAFPAVNGRIEGPDIVYNNVYDIGVAVSTDRGLMVPVLRDADRMSFADIERTIAAFATKARDGTIAVSDLQGGTFTITNGGIFGSLLSTPILNPPQSGILGMHAIQKRPVVVDDQIVIRPMMYLALSYDHRIIDGREAVRFLVRVKEGVENPERLWLGL
jgi:2-oxoglutarate dehydrogenase E2 component (dihydrolipoamide succinyltransferase)